jgi:hypothetical protein
LTNIRFGSIQFDQLIHLCSHLYHYACSHYFDYDWSELVEENIHGYVMDLGWTEQLWLSNGTTVSEDLYWDELSQIQRDAAWAICYFEETWNVELSIDQWPAGFPHSSLE